MQTTIQTGRPAEFAPEAIIQAGQELRDAGRNITGFALRQKVGGGNPGRLKQVWDEHLTSQSVTKAEPVAELPIEVAEEIAMVTKNLTDRLYMLAVELNDKAVKAAERRVAEIVRAAGDQRPGPPALHGRRPRRTARGTGPRRRRRLRARRPRRAAPRRSRRAPSPTTPA